MIYISVAAVVLGLVAFNVSFDSKRKIKELEHRVSELEKKSGI
ncbi:hypothetical protein AA0X95_04845 [Bacillus sp. 1P10SD]